MTYRGFNLGYDPPPIPVRNADYWFVDDNEETRGGHGSSFEDCKRKIDEMIEEDW